MKRGNFKGDDSMRKAIVFMFVAVLLVSNASIAKGKPSMKVLVDESRVYELDPLLQELLIRGGSLPKSFWDLFDWSYSFDNVLEPWGFGFAKWEIERIASVDIRKKGKLSYSTLKDYDVLVLASFGESYSTAEVDAIRRFVENGGGLLLLGDFEYPNNNIARAFDVLYYSEMVVIGDKKAEKFYSDSHTFYVTDIEKHPITKGVDQIAFFFGIPILSYESGRVLARTSEDSWADKDGLGSKDAGEDEGPFDVLLAMENVGKGRAVFFGGAISFWNSVIFEPDQQNLELLSNAVEWLGEPGGPYKQYKAVNEQAKAQLANAKSLYNAHKFSLAKGVFEDAIDAFEESNEIYPSTEAEEGIEEAEEYIKKCETGIKADNTFDTAQDLYSNREYEKAIEEFEEAKLLYQEIEYTERAQECDTKIDESNQWIALRDEATSLFQKGEDALTTAPSAFSPAGYEEAKSIFEQAKSKWEEYNDPDQVSACDEKITLCDDGIAKIRRNRVMTIVGVVVAIVVVVVIIVVRKRKAKVPTAEPEVGGVGEIGETSPKEAEIPAKADVSEALNKRYTKGEITKEEYEQLKAALEKE